MMEIKGRSEVRGDAREEVEEEESEKEGEVVIERIKEAKIANNYY